MLFFYGQLLMGNVELKYKHLVGLNKSSKGEEMEKIIRISNKDYRMKASALTQFSYRDETGRSFLTDLQKLTELKDIGEEINSSIDALDNLSEMLLKMAYIMVREADKTQATNYEEFLGGIESLYDDTAWIQEVLELACTPLSRQLQNNKD